ncbi:MAG: UDP-N-acetylmuramoyl-L-alanine--D-glutamate ligase [Chloroflexota bacterium]|jgi:UDP-N-acetylmuramoylalanine--D-glutamate ligase
MLLIEMREDLVGKRIVILGLARQGKALARFAANQGAIVVVSDVRPAEALQPEIEELSDIAFEAVLGDHPLSLLDDADMLAVSGGVPDDAPLLASARKRGIPITNDSLEFIKRVQGTVIGITGSAGKTTTTALTGAMIRESGRQAWVGGNIGHPLISELENIRSNDIVVQELSSFQLQYWTESPPIAAVLNITPNHLDRHKTMVAYREAKSNILRFQTPNDMALLSADDPGTGALRHLVRGRLREFSLELPVEDGAFVGNGKIRLRDTEREWVICDLADIPLRGQHNVRNVLAASVLADSVGVTAQEMKQAIREFDAVEHRLELVRTINGVQYVNDSIATSPERAIAALESFEEPVILLAGGRDKNMVWGEWGDIVIKRAKATVLFGELRSMMADLLTRKATNDASSPMITEVEQLSEAVRVAAKIAQPGDVVLLAPGGTSFDAFVDFAARGEFFRREVGLLADAQEEHSG